VITTQVLLARLMSVQISPKEKRSAGVECDGTRSSGRKGSGDKLIVLTHKFLLSGCERAEVARLLLVFCDETSTTCMYVAGTGLALGLVRLLGVGSRA
jgi:hypothetical protein